MTPPEHHSSPILAVAPMEGLTTHVYRRLHSQMFGGADEYYMPFVTPTVQPKFTARQLRDIAPEKNIGVNVVPQRLEPSWQGDEEAVF